MTQIHRKELQTRRKELQTHKKELQTHRKELPMQRKELQTHMKELQTHTKELQTHRMELQTRRKELQTRRRELRTHRKWLERRMENHSHPQLLQLVLLGQELAVSHTPHRLPPPHVQGLLQVQAQAHCMAGAGVWVLSHGREAWVCSLALACKKVLAYI